MNDNEEQKEIEEKDALLSSQQTKILDHLRETELETRIVVFEQECNLGVLMELVPGALLMFDATVEDPAWLSINGKRFAEGDVVDSNGMYGLMITKL